MFYTNESVLIQENVNILNISLNVWLILLRFFWHYYITFNIYLLKM